MMTTTNTKRGAGLVRADGSTERHRQAREQHVKRWSDAYAAAASTPAVANASAVQTDQPAG